MSKKLLIKEKFFINCGRCNVTYAQNERRIFIKKVKMHKIY